jgi:hypothetical protein
VGWRSKVLDLVKQLRREARRGLDAVVDYVKEKPGRSLLRVALFGTWAAGLWALGTSLTYWISLGLAAVALLAALPDSWKAIALEVIGAFVVAVATLLGTNVVIDLLIHATGLYDEDSPAGWIAVGLVVALVVFWAAAYFYLRWRGNWVKERAWPARIVAAVLAVLFVLGAPVAYGVLHEKEKRKKVPRQGEVLSQLDVFVVSAGGGRPAEIPPAGAFASRAVDVRHHVGFAQGARVRWTLDGASEHEALRALSEEDAPAIEEPAARPRADRVLVLVVDGTPAYVENPARLPDVAGDEDEVDRWRAIAERWRESANTRDRPAAAYALLQTKDEDRIERWREPDGVLDPVPLPDFGSAAVTDAAFRLAVDSPTAREDLVLAERYRPLLLFDSGEPVPRPLSVEALFQAKRIRQCPLHGNLDDCSERLTSSAALTNGETRLELDRYPPEDLQAAARRDLQVRPKPPPTTPAGGVDAATPPAIAEAPGQTEFTVPRTTMYVHAVPRTYDRKKLLFLDYWWYLPDNPARAGSGAFCGAGLVIPGISCFDHKSDWEGITVVVNRSTPEPKLEALHYAEHSSVVRYRPEELTAYWKTLPAIPTVDEDSERPRVFVADGTHAAYPTLCRGDNCRQTAAEAEEQSHDGGRPWAGNATTDCGGGVSCLTQFPTLAGGRAPALWNAFEGPWGNARCFLKYYCNSTTPPAAPGKQGRYRRPWRCSGEGRVTRAGRRSFTRGPCEY